MNKQTEPAIALVYDKVNTAYGGAEHVLTALHEAFPKAPLFTSVYDRQTALWAKPFKVYASFLQKLPLAKKYHQLFTSLMPIAFESFDLSAYDIIISITSAEAKGVLTKPGQLHICYMLTPPRYLYSHQEEYLDDHWFTRPPILRQIARLLLRYQRWWDKAAAHRPDVIIPISKLVQSRIKAYYGRATEPVIYPPIPPIAANNRVPEILPIQGFYLTASRLVAYKKIDLAIEACQKLNKLLVVVGDGLQANLLHQLAGAYGIQRYPGETLSDFLGRGHKNRKLILFTGKVSSQDLYQLTTQSKALIMPGLEDFGITALQAVQLGKPVIIHEKSGAAELLSEPGQAIFIKHETPQALVTAITKLEEITFNIKPLKNLDKQSFTTQFSKKVYDLFIWHQQRKDDHEFS